MSAWQMLATIAVVDRRLFFCALLLGAVFLAEAFGGYWSGSQALLADAWHMLSDLTAQGVGLAGAVFALRPPSRRKTYGWEGMKIFAAAANGVLLVAVAAFRVFPDATYRLWQPEAVVLTRMVPMAVAGLVVNLIIHHVLKRDVSFERDLNLQGVLLHVDADLAASGGVIVSAILIWLFGWQRADPMMSMFIGCGMVFVGTRFVIKNGHLLLGGVPEGVEVEGIEERLLAIRGVQAVKDLHVWSWGGMPLASVHLVHVMGLSMRAKQAIQRMAGRVFCAADIHHWAVHMDTPNEHPHCIRGARLP